MKSITIHNLDDELDARIREKAAREGLSLNKTLKKLLCEALGIKEKGQDHLHDFLEFSGVWTEKELSEFEKRTSGLGKVDENDWQ